MTLSKLINMPREPTIKNMNVIKNTIIKATTELENMIRQNITARANNTPQFYYGCINLLSLQIQAMKIDIILGRAIMSNSNTLIRAAIEKQDNIYKEILELLFEDQEHIQEGLYIDIMNQARDCLRANEKTLESL